MLTTKFTGLWIHAGKAGTGKSMDLCRQAVSMAATGLNVVILDLESPVAVTRTRLAVAAGELGVPVTTKVGLLPVCETVEALRHQVMLLHVLRTIDVLLIDHLGLLDSAAKEGEPPWVRAREVVLELKSISLELGLPILVTAQIKRDGDLPDQAERVADTVSLTSGTPLTTVIKKSRQGTAPPA